MYVINRRLKWFVFGIAILVGSSAWAQSIGGGQTGTGATLSTGQGFGTTGFGSTGFGSTGFGSSGFGSGSTGTGFGQSGFGQGGFGSSGFGGTGFGQGGVGQSASGFIGRDSGDVAAMFENMTRQGEQFMNRVERSINRSRNAGEDVQQTQQQVRVKLKIGFDYPDPATAPMTVAFDARLSQLLAGREVAGMSVKQNGSEVVIAGTAGNEFERMLVEQLISQQPGVTRVTNQMTVGEAIAVPTPLE